MKSFKKLLIALGSGLILTACGGSGSSSNTNSDDVKINISVPTENAKKSKVIENSTVESVTVVNLENDENISAEQDGSVYTASVPGNSDLHIIVKIRNQNGNLITFEKYIDNLSDTDHEINEDTTKLAGLLVKEGSDKNRPVKDLLAEDTDVIRGLEQDLERISSRDFINSAISNSSSDESLATISSNIESAIKRLEELQEVIEKIENRIRQFENETGVEHDVIKESDVETDGEFGDDIDSELLTENLVRPNGVNEIHETGEFIFDDNQGENNNNTNTILIEIDENGNIVITRGNESHNIDIKLPKDKITGKFLGLEGNKLLISVMSANHERLIELVVPEDDKDLNETLQFLKKGSFIGAKFKEVDGTKVLVKIFAEGVTRGELKEISESKITLILEDNSEVTFNRHEINEITPVSPSPNGPISEEDVKNGDVKDNTGPIVRGKEVDSTTAAGLLIESNGPIHEGDKNEDKEENDIFVRMDVVDASATTDIRPQFELKVGDKVAVHWVVEQNKVLVLGVFPAKKSEDKGEIDPTNPSTHEIFVEGKIESLTDTTFVVGNTKFHITSDTLINFDKKLENGDAVFVIGVQSKNGGYDATEIGSLKLEDPVVTQSTGSNVSDAK